MCSLIRELADHPRVCGENYVEAGTDVRADGSPPRVRGKHYDSNRDSGAVRITPACAGKTKCYGAGSGLHEDHPRVCGENVCSIFAAFPSTGSPPRVRGKHFGNGVFPWLILVLSLDPL